MQKNLKKAVSDAVDSALEGGSIDECAEAGVRAALLFMAEAFDRKANESQKSGEGVFASPAASTAMFASSDAFREAAFLLRYAVSAEG